MRHSVLLVLAIASCSTRPDTTTAPADAAARPAGFELSDMVCSDVATASLNLGDATPAPMSGCTPGLIAVAMNQTTQWTLRSEGLKTGDSLIPVGAGTDVAAGYDVAAFVLDGPGAAIRRVEGETVVDLVQGEELRDARALVRIGGSLYVGTPRGIVRVSLSDASITTVREGLDVLDLTVDDIGALLVLTSSGLSRMLPSGDDARLTRTDIDATRIAFDLTTAQLLAVDGRGVVQRIDYGTLVPEGPDSRPVQHGEMGPFSESGYILAGAEYWPHRGSTPAKYPEEILWGFYPHEGEVFEGSAAVATATDAAVACAEQSYAALRAWIPTATEALGAAAATGKAPRFYLWVNDYSQADDPFPAQMRQAKLWYWARDPAVAGRIPGYFKWETVVDQKGECHWPEADQAAAFLREDRRP